MTTTESYAAFATQAKEATEKSVAAFKLAAKPLTAAATVNTDVPKAVVEPVQRYFQFVRQAAQANVDLATTWTQLVTAFSGVAAFSGVTGKRVTKVGDATAETVEAVGEAAAEAVETADEAAVDTAETIADLAATATSSAEPTAEEQAGEGAESELERDLAAERAEAKHAHELAREPYRSLTKAELSALLAERGLPKTGTVGTLIERLVAADAKS